MTPAPRHEPGTVRGIVTGLLLEAAKRIDRVYPPKLADQLLDLETAPIDAADARIIVAERAGDLELATKAVAEWERAWFRAIEARTGKGTA